MDRRKLAVSVGWERTPLARTLIIDVDLGHRRPMDLAGQHRPSHTLDPLETSRKLRTASSESRALLDFLFTLMASPRFQCRFQWRPNSLAFWDNRCAQHLALWDYYPETRSGHRFTIAQETAS